MTERFKEHKNHEGYADFTAYLALKNIEKEKKNMIEKILKGDIFVINRPDEEPGDPAVVVSADNVNDTSPFVLCVYLKDYRNELKTDVQILAGTVKTARVESIQRIHKSRLGDYIRTCKQNEIDKINQAISVAFDIKFSESADPEEFKELKEANGKLLNEVAQLYNQIGITQREYAEQVGNVEELQKCLSEAEKRCSYMRDEVERLEDEKQDDKEMIVLKTERDLYKRLYEETMDKLLGAKA